MENGIKAFLKDKRLFNNPTQIARMDAQNALNEYKSNPVINESLQPLAQMMWEEFIENELSGWYAKFMEKEKSWKTE